MIRETLPEHRSNMIKFLESRGVSCVPLAHIISPYHSVQAPGRTNGDVSGEISTTEAEVEVLNMREERDGLDEEDERVRLVWWVGEEHGPIVRPLTIFSGNVNL